MMSKKTEKKKCPICAAKIKKLKKEIKKLKKKVNEGGSSYDFGRGYPYE